jgi:type I restriction enzyme S subunit
MTFEKVELGAVSKFFNNLRKPVTRSNRVSGAYRYFGAAGIQDYVSEYLFDGDFILVGEDGTVITEDDRPVVQQASGKFWVNNHAHVIQPNEMADFDYLYFAISSTKVRDLVTGAVQPKLSMTNLKQLQIPWVADSAVRLTIGSILKILDEKIASNNQVSKTLEDIAQTVFKSWFIDFDPVMAKMAGEKPAGIDDAIVALFPDSMEESELGLIPRGWKINLLGDLVTPKKGKTITRASCVVGDVPVVAGGLQPAYFHNTANVLQPAITVSASGANAGYVRLYLEDIWASDCSYINSEITQTVHFWYLFLSRNQELIYGMQQGAAQPHIYPSDLMRLKVSYPNSIDTVLKFEETVTPLFLQIGVLERQNESLRSLRDSLLPRLISGELQIPEEMLVS